LTFIGTSFLRYALERTGLLQAYRSAFSKLARINKADPDPHPLVVWFFDDHPPIRRAGNGRQRGPKLKQRRRQPVFTQG
jgi:hypothetical protein